MVGFFKQWAANVSEYKRLQQELTVALARTGQNFMHLHPEITKFLVGMAREEGASVAVERLDETRDMIRTKFPGLKHEEAKQQLIIIIEQINRLAKSR